ncbi:MAG: NADH-quinone oxidoreductase subunit J [Planctomycetes bacterium]|jgi:NADH-quinone oxidoreductase subunit J|nr:NADH-quinone oxidoreductase subunit J [Planctomycetota bacterium]MBT6452809.1 NADH-quinone oxidoreductase subunit J [Planctomycetota bacterium]MBT6541657.1 NADH-quinone oxidoreductase subunit J [Planctomycetota bacterium]MBT6785572.1 NADH-quinone oxidoreductase subunit J [Planctomycetota bacterium]MBT6967576.1 NADH-quinone oxidoreductase subunit J [Planctomycetota bacterium]
MSPGIEQLFFGIAAVVATVSSLLVVTRRNPIYSAMFLIVMFAAVSVIFMLLDATFLGFMQLLVYAGAIMVLYLFVIMLINPRDGDLPEESGVTEKSFAAGVALLIFSLLSFAISHSNEVERLSSLGPIPLIPEVSASHGTIRAFGLELFQKHLLVFELTSVLVLAGIIGAVHLASRGRKDGSTAPSAAGKGLVNTDV